MEGSIFWDVTPYILVDDYGRFRGTHYLHLQDRGVSPVSPSFDREDS
jgi:hypothetical protein